VVPVNREQLQDGLAGSAETHGPGLFGLVTDGGEVVFEGSAGVADLAEPRPLTADDQFRIGSITKTYVTALVLQLIAEGAFAATDTLEHWLPGLVPGGEDITVELLLRMRTGLPDYVWPLLGDPPDVTRLVRYYPPEELVAIALGVPGRTPPDTAYRYCNTDYVLLGLVVERATGQRVDVLLWQRIFAPLGLDATTFPTADGRLRGPHATGYLRMAADAPYQELPVVSPSEAWTSGAIVASPRDLAAFYDGLFGGRVLDPAGLARMTTPLEDLGPGRQRGLGFVRYEYADGTVAFGHHGGVPGYTTLVLRTTGGRCVVLAQNGTDLPDILTSDTPFVAAALTSR
jgi:D-alanyl-D-alanine carboxypeptidase